MLLNPPQRMWLAFYGLVMLFLSMLLGPAAHGESSAEVTPILSSTDEVLISTSELTVTARDVSRYLKFLAFTQGNSAPMISSQRASQAIIEMYALRTLDADAQSAGLLQDADSEWIAEYLIAMERVRYFLRLRVEEMLDATDWDREALEYYLANKTDFKTPETVDLRTLLLRLEDRTLDEGLELIDSLVTPDMTPEDFESTVRALTEDKVAARSGGLMQGLKKGQTVPPFEQAAFALKEPGDIASPVVSVFGVHAIQLLGRTPARQKTFEEAKDEIVSKLLPLRREEYFDSLRAEAKTREPESFEINEPAVEAFMGQFLGGSPDRFLMPED